MNWKKPLTITGAAVAAQCAWSAPNIVLIYADDLGWSDLSAYGNTYHQSPNIDSLMQHGVRFTQAYSAAPLCAPSRVALLSGRVPARESCYEVVQGIYTSNMDVNEVPVMPPDNSIVLPSDTGTLTEILSSAGYRCGIMGKWHLGSEVPQDRGFEEYMRLSNDSHTNLTTAYIDRSAGYPAPDGYSYATDYLNDCSIHFLDQADSRPFFLFMSHVLVHTPIEAEPDLQAKYEALPGSDYHQNARYAAMVESLDNSVGLLMDELRSRGLLTNTLVIFTSDNGGLLGGTRTTSPEGLDLGWITSNYPLQSGKSALKEGGIRIPMSFYFPGTITTGQVSDVVVEQVDLLPTLLDFADVALPSGIKYDGESLYDLLTGGSQEMPERDLFWHYPGYRTLQGPASAIRFGDWKMLEDLVDGSVELYDLASDVSELTDVAARHPKLVEGLRSRLAAWREDTEAPMPSYRITFASAQGYVNGNLGTHADWGGSHYPYWQVETNSSGEGWVNVGYDATHSNPNRRAFHDTALSVSNQAYSMSATFDFERTDGGLSADSEILGLEFCKGSSSWSFTDGLRLSLRRFKLGTGYSINFASSSGTTHKGAWIPQGQLGLGSSDGVSARLKLTFRITRGADATDWSYTGTLENLTAGTVVQSVASNSGCSAVFYQEDIDIALNNLTGDIGMVSNMTVYSVEYITTPMDALRGYPVWSLLHELDGADSADDDGDGQANLEEYALGGDPADPLNAGIPPSFKFLSQTNITFTHAVRLDPCAGLLYQVEQSTNLVAGGWSSEEGAVLTNAAETGFGEVTHQLNSEGASQKFFRLKIVRP